MIIGIISTINNIKNIFKFFFILMALIILLGSDTYAYTNKYFEIETPNNYQISKSGTTVTFDRQDGVAISINIVENEDKQNIIQMNNDELQKGYETALEQVGYYDIKTENSEKTIISDIDAIKYKTSSKIQNITAYIEAYYISTENYIYGITIISTTKEYFSSNEYKNIMNSIKILDKELTSNTEDKNFSEATIKALIKTIPFAIIVYLIYTTKKNKKRKKVKKCIVQTAEKK